MKTLAHFIVVLAACLCFAALPAKALDISETVWLERYTVTNGSLQLDQGNLMKNGNFRVLMSEIVSPVFYDSLSDFGPFSGKLLMAEQLYTAYKPLGYIPKWVRSRDTFTVGYMTYVAVAVSGKGDPNPTITVTAQPENERVLQGYSAFFLVEAEPWEYLSYQWMFKGKPIVGATSSWLWMTNVGKAQAGIYTVSLSTGGKGIVSRKAILQVVTPVVIKTEPKTQTVKAGKNAVFRVAVTGTGPFTYQWYWNDAPITNATKSFYTVPKVQAGNAGAYSVYVDNGPSGAWSDDAILTVVP
jgi:hypothetical protein